MQEQLGFSRLLLWVGIVAGFLMVLTVFAGKAPLAFVFWFISAAAGLPGIHRASRAMDESGDLPIHALLVALVPFLGIMIMWQWLGVIKVGLEVAAQEKAEKAAQKAAQRKAAAAAPTPRAQRYAADLDRTAAALKTATSAQLESRSLTNAIASVKLAGLQGEPEGALLKVEVQSPLAEGGSEDDRMVMRVSKGFGVAYLVDKGEFYTYANHGDLKRTGTGPSELHAIGLRNLTALVNGKPGLSVHEAGPVHALIMGGQFEASLVLVDELWDGPLKQYAPNGFVVAIPSRDVLAFCDAKSAEGLAELKRVVARVSADGVPPITDQLYARRGGRWEPLEGPKRPDLAPLEFK